MNQLAKASKSGALYARMQTAITNCHSVDEAKEIANQAHAMAAYYKQISDDESVRKFVAIKMRAFRRIGEICLTISDAGCSTQAAYIQLIRQQFPTISASHVYQALQVGRLPADFFESTVSEATSVSSLLDSYKQLLDAKWRESPEGKEALLRQTKEEMDRYAAWQREVERETAEKRERQQEAQELRDLKAARDEAREEVGVTLDRRDRETMHEIVFLVKVETHATLRKAAFDKHMTMQAIIRAGLKMWFIAHGYPIEDESPKAARARRAA